MIIMLITNPKPNLTDYLPTSSHFSPALVSRILPTATPASPHLTYAGFWVLTVFQGPAKSRKYRPKGVNDLC